MKNVQIPAPVFFSDEEKDRMNSNPEGYAFRRQEQTEEGERVAELEKTVEWLKNVITTRENELRSCVNELCYKCGDYRMEHEGACKGCKWAAIRRRETA